MTLLPDEARRVLAAIDLTERTGAHQFALGYGHTRVAGKPIGTWTASAVYRGGTISASAYSPHDAAERLAIRLLTGAKCADCSSLVALSSDGAVAYPDAEMADGTLWTHEEQLRAGFCRWYLANGRTWTRGCEEEHPDDAHHSPTPPG